MEEGQFMENILELSQFVFEHLPRLDTKVNYWLVRTESGKYYDHFNSSSFIALGWDAIDKEILKKVKSDAGALKANVERYYKDDKQPGRTANQILSFINDIKVGDMVLIPSEGSEQYMLGKVTSDLYFETDDNNADLSKCPFIKRRKVTWIKSFWKKDADSKLLKLSYRQQTVNEINEYKTFINRALYSAYIDADDNVHLTYGINIDDNINMVDLSEFLFKYTRIYESLTGDKDIDIKINAQSKGKSEIISKTFGGITVAVLLFGLAQLPYGGEVSIGGGILPEVSVKTNGIIPQKEKMEAEREEIEIKKERADRENTAKDLQNLKQAVELSKELDVPIESLNIELPEEVVTALKQKKTDLSTSNTESEN